MASFVLKKSLCGCSLKTGTLILLWISVISAAFSLFTASASPISNASRSSKAIRAMMLHNTVSCLMLMVVSIAGLYGVEKKKPSMLIPYIGFNILSTVIFAVEMLLLLANWSSVFTDEFLEKILKDVENQEKINEDPEFRKHFKDTVSSLAYYIILLVFIIGTVLETYFTLVVYSCYKMMVAKRRETGIFYSSTVADDKVQYPSSMHGDWNTNIPAYPPPYNELPIASSGYMDGKSASHSLA